MSVMYNKSEEKYNIIRFNVRFKIFRYFGIIIGNLLYDIILWYIFYLFIFIIGIFKIIVIVVEFFVKL